MAFSMTSEVNFLLSGAGRLLTKLSPLAGLAINFPVPAIVKPATVKPLVLIKFLRVVIFDVIGLLLFFIRKNLFDQQQFSFSELQIFKGSCIVIPLSHGAAPIKTE